MLRKSATVKGRKYSLTWIIKRQNNGMLFMSKDVKKCPISQVICCLFCVIVVIVDWYILICCGKIQPKESQILIVTNIWIAVVESGTKKKENVLYYKIQVCRFCDEKFYILNNISEATPLHF